MFFMEQVVPQMIIGTRTSNASMGTVLNPLLQFYREKIKCYFTILLADVHILPQRFKKTFIKIAYEVTVSFIHHNALFVLFFSKRKHPSLPPPPPPPPTPLTPSSCSHNSRDLFASGPLRSYSVYSSFLFSMEV